MSGVEPEKDQDAADDYKEETDDKAKADYIVAALKNPWAFEETKPLGSDLLMAIEWSKDKTPQEMMHTRECVIGAVEQLAKQIKDEGLDREWHVLYIY